jgi:hypothetical protein
MRRTFGELIGATTLMLMLSLTWLVCSGEAHAQRFMDNQDGTVTDTTTRLMWSKDAGLLGSKTWEQAMIACGSLAISGKSRWRLPSKDELVVLSQALRGEHPFGGISFGSYWSSTLIEDWTYNPWWVLMYNSHVFTDPRTATHKVWCVRDHRH